MGERRGAYRVLVEKPEGKGALGRPNVDGRIILRWVFKKWGGRYELGSSGSVYGQVAGI
jgi:hypothetical protein